MKKREKQEIEDHLAEVLKKDLKNSREGNNWRDFHGYYDVDSLAFGDGSRFGGRRWAKRMLNHIKTSELFYVEHPVLPEFTINSSARGFYQSYQSICFKRNGFHGFAETFKGRRIVSHGAIDIYAKTAGRGNKSCNIFARVLVIKAWDEHDEANWVSKPIILGTSGLTSGFEERKLEMYLIFFARLYPAIQYVFEHRPEVFSIISARKECRTRQNGKKKDREQVVVRRMVFDESEYAKMEDGKFTRSQRIKEGL